MSRAFGIYIHVPFCRARCPYCDFSTDIRTPIPHDVYTVALQNELARRAGLFAGRRARSIYFGGGTPSLLRPDCLGRLVRAIATRFGQPEETTCEVNPENADPKTLEQFALEGITRVSIGVQSLCDTTLRALGRMHSAAEAEDAVRAARRVFPSVSCDLIFGGPGQTFAHWQRDVAQLIALEPNHVSLYALTVEPDTPFGQLKIAGRLVVPDDSSQTEMYEAAIDWLEAAGYEHYEVSNFARAGHPSRHNSLYWSDGEYLGLGASAHSRRVEPDGSSERFANPAGLNAYLSDPGTNAMVEKLDREKTKAESIWLGLRMRKGIQRERIARVPEDLLKNNLLEECDGYLRLTRRGLLAADTVGARFLKPDAPVVENPATMMMDDMGTTGDSAPPDEPLETPESPTPPSEEAQSPTAEPTAEPTSEPPGEPVESVPTAEERLSALEAEKQEIWNRLLRTAADLDNFRKRARRDIADSAVQAREEVIREFLPIADNLERALMTPGESDRATSPVLEGVRLVQRQLMSAFERFEIRPFDALGKLFDPTLHEALQQLETEETPPGTVVQQWQRGYRLGARVLRPALVVVSRAPTLSSDPAVEPPATDPLDAGTERAGKEPS